MAIYSAGCDITSAENIIPLDPTIHKAFDKRMFAIVPKRATEDSPAQYVTHVLRADAEELWPDYHNVAVQNLNVRSRPYSFGRFAWAILQLVKPFITARVARKVVQVNITDDEVEYHVKSVDAKTLFNKYGSKSSILTSNSPSSGTMSAGELEEVSDDEEFSEMSVDSGDSMTEMSDEASLPDLQDF
ncbi:hypothetical protein F5884DRAFT_81661 [Xylogone sp. PMI_703]|nr:hypothetical protein F5884DRAFT_81661 [Xylogone sp. PMI_703]